MADPLHVTNVSLFPAGRVSRRSGLYGWLTFELNGVLAFEGATLRLSAEGRFYVSFPTRRDGNGREHHLVRPLDDATRREIEEQILSALRRQGRLAS
jgi:DNA-binding cell septation regulator SpoVG